ncbi:MAG: hypothetical protein QOE14_2892 [Humisphaera sp.]|nr:hypothetical protein [Humisphaera sp.]
MVVERDGTAQRSCRTLSRGIFALIVLFLAPEIARADANLRVMDTRHYRIHTDLDKKFAEELGRRMDAMYDDYTRRLADFNPAGDAKFEVYLFKRRTDYLGFTKNKVPNTGGVFMPARNTLAAFLEGQGRDALRRTLQHEAFHQFAHSAINPDLPPWLNEGLATVFEEGIFLGKSFALGQVPPRRVRQLHDDLDHGRLIPFREMMTMSLDDWSGALNGAGTRGATQYNQAWAMCHFLIFAQKNGDTLYRRRFLELLARIHKGEDAMDAFAAAFSDNIGGFERLFKEFAANVQSTPVATMIERQDILADMLTILASREQRFDSIEQFRKTLANGGYRMSYQKGDLKWTTDADPTTYFNNLNGDELTRHEMFFDPRSGAPIPDLVLRAPKQLRLRTRFHDAPGGKIEHEVLIDEPAK